MGRGHLAPPASLVLAHGAGSGPWAFAGWRESFDGTEVLAVDLYDGLDMAHESHEDYASRVVGAAGERGAAVAELYGSEPAEFPGLGHWDLVRSPEVRRSIARFLGIG